MAKANPITQEYLRSILHYDPETGIFTWRFRVKAYSKPTASGHPGITWNNTCKRWMSRISAFGERVYIGVYKTIESAAVAQQKKLDDLNAKYAGKPTGYTTESGHITISIDNKNYLSHRLAWLYMTGEWPPNGIDHRDGIPSNNRWSNLRLATQSQNNANAKLRSDNKTGHKGVTWCEGSRAYQVHVSFNGVRHYFGCFNDPEKAAKVYREKAAELFGEFARFE